ncbi:MAG: hypothetical protein ACOYYS_23655 [Chloroflexota bacterium]
MACDVSRLLSKKQILIAMPLLMLAATAAMANALYPVSFIFIWELQVVRGIRGPVLYKDFMEQAAAGERATVISVVSLITRLTFVGLSPFVGWIVDTYNISKALNFIALAMIVCFSAVAVWYRFAFQPLQSIESPA